MKFLSSEKLSPHKYKTPEGYLICTDAILARTGKQTYRKNEVFADSEDDSEIDVDRKPEEVFSPKTLASFENKPITVEHPDEDVNAGNYNELSVGFVRDVRRGQVNGQDVMLGTLVITDAQTIEEIENGEHTDLSCGYDCDIIDEANPQQRNIRGNHVALCQQGRAGIARIVDSVKDEDIFKVDVSSAEDRDVSRFITEAQNVGFTTEDKGYTIYLKNGNRDMLNRLKARTYTTDIKFVDSIKDDYFTSLPDRVKKSEFNDLYYKIREKTEDKWNYRVSTYGDKFKIEIEKAVGAAPGVYGPVGGQWKTVKTIYSIEDSIKDAEMIKVNGVNIIVAKSKEEIPERTHFKQEVQYNGKAYYWHEGLDTKRNYLVPIVGSVKDDLVCGYTEQDLRIAKNMLSKAVSENEKKLIESLIAKIKYELTNQEMRDSYDYIGNAMIFKSLPKIGEKAQKYGFGYSDSVISKIEKTYNKDGYQFYIVYCMDEDDYKNNRETQYHYSIAIKDSSNTSIGKDSSIKDARWDKNTLVKAFKLYGNTLGSEAEDWAEDVVQNGPKNIDELDYWFNHQATIISRDNMRNVINYLKAHNALRDSKKYEISYVEDSIEHIHVVRATSLKEAINKMKGGK